MSRIIVTGGAQGIGRAIVELLLADSNTEVVVIDKQQTRFIDECCQEFAGQFTFYLQDIAVPDKLAVVLEEIGKHEVDGIVNNAGEVYLENWKSLKLDTWNRTIAVNLTAPLQIVHQLRDSLTSGASIVNIASTDGYNAAFDTLAYAASKAGLMNLTKSLAAVLGQQRVRVNAVAPGWVETEMTKGTLPVEAASMTPLGRNTPSVDVAEVVLFLLSLKAASVNGEVITVDSGLNVIDYTIKRESEQLIGEI